MNELSDEGAIGYAVIRVRQDLIPQGGTLVEAYETETEIIVIGTPESRSTHNCDAMGCGTLSHVTYRLSKA